MLHFVRAVVGFLYISSAWAETSLTTAQKTEIQAVVQKEVQAALSRVNPPLSEDAIRDIVQSMITKNFKHLQDALGVAFMIAKDAALKEAHQEKALGTHKAVLFQEKLYPALGKPEASQVAIMFSDPYCGHCSQSMTNFEAYIQKHPQARLIIHNYPIYGKSSHQAVLAFLAAHLQTKYLPFYKAFQKAVQAKKNTLNEEELLQVAKNLGLNISQFKKDLAGETTKGLLKKTIALGKDFHVTGTPTFVVRGEKGAGRVIEGDVEPKICFETALK